MDEPPSALSGGTPPLSLLRHIACAISVAAAIAQEAGAAPPLSGYGADISAVTVSGVSSGGYMAVQMHVAHSASVKGAGVLSGGPWYCAGGSALRAYWNCMRPRAWTPLPPLTRLHDATAATERARRIDATRNLATARVWLFSGSRDRTVYPEVVAALADYYRHYVEPSAVRLVRDIPAGHAMPSAEPGLTQSCEATRSPYLNRCTDPATGAPFDAAGALLAHLLGPARLPARDESGSLLEFDQSPFAGGRAHAVSLAATGYLYVPAACRTERCGVHVAFHGCGQQAGAIGEKFARDAGYNRWADAYRLIILYPQVTARYGWGLDGTFVVNPNGCWDWWGYTGADYHTRAGPQIRAAKAMVDRLGEPR